MAMKKLVLNLTNYSVSKEITKSGIEIVPLDQLELTFENVNRIYQIIKEGVLDNPEEEDIDIYETYEDFVAYIFPFYLRNASTTFLAQRDSQIIGISTFIKRFNKWAECRFTTVTKGKRRKGIAKILKIHAIKHAQDIGLEKIITEIEETNIPMLKLAESIGFQVVY